MAQCMNDSMIPTNLAEIVVASILIQLSRILSKMGQWLLESNCHWAKRKHPDLVDKHLYVRYNVFGALAVIRCNACSNGFAWVELCALALQIGSSLQQHHRSTSSCSPNLLLLLCRLLVKTLVLCSFSFLYIPFCARLYIYPASLRLPRWSTRH